MAIPVSGSRLIEQLKKRSSTWAKRRPWLSNPAAIPWTLPTDASKLSLSVSLSIIAIEQARIIQSLRVRTETEDHYRKLDELGFTDSSLQYTLRCTVSLPR